MPIERAILIAMVLSAEQVLAALVIFRIVPDFWKKNRLLAGVYVFAFLVLINGGLVALLASGWFADPANASTIQGIAAAAQALFAAILIGLTVRTVQANADIAQETRVMARETEKMAAAAVQQQRAATRPVLVFRIHPLDGHTAPAARAFVIEAFNVGAGPALDARVSYTGPFRFVEPKDYVQPLAIATGERPGFTFRLDVYSPLQDQSHPLKWPRTEEDAELMQEDEALETAQVWKRTESPENERLRIVRSELKNRSNRYDADLTARIAEQRDIGQIRAEYRDLSGEVHVSTADLVVINPESRHAVEQKAAELAELSGMDIWSFSPYWPDLMLGSLSVESPPAIPGIEEGAT